MGAPLKIPADTLRRDEALAFIVDRIVRAGVCPTASEVGRALGVSRQRGQQLIDELTREGVFEKTPGSPRSLRIRDLVQCRHIIVATLGQLGFTLAEPGDEPAAPLSPAQLPMLPPFEHLPDPQ